MSKTLKSAVKTHVADIVHHGDQLTIPEGMSVDNAIKLLVRRKEFLDEETAFSETYNVFPWDGAHALDEVLTKMFGWAPATATPGFFGPTPPKLISVEVAPGEFKEVPWGRFTLPNVEGFVQCSLGRDSGRVVFSLAAKVKRKDEQIVRRIFAELRDYLKTNSIYEGKAVKIRFRDDSGQLLDMPEPKFIDTKGISKEMLVYPKDVEDQVETSLFTPIERVQDCINNGIPVKRGVLLGGKYGCGKTLAATVASKLAVDNGVTYLYVPRADELADAIEFAKQYSKTACVIFCEDIDRSLAGERSVKIDDILNILDGIDTKNSRIITVLTTNHIENINPAMLRPGRLDAVINVTAPDAEAAQRLVRLYGEDTIDADTDLTQVGETLAGHIPAVIAEVVKRAKLTQLSLIPKGHVVEGLSAEALLIAAKSIAEQVDLLETQSAIKKPNATINDMIADVVAKANKPLADDVAYMKARF